MYFKETSKINPAYKNMMSALMEEQMPKEGECLSSSLHLEAIVPFCHKNKNYIKAEELC